MAQSLVKAGRYSVRYGSEVISFALRLQPERKPSKVAIHVEPDGRVVVDAPEGVSHESVMAAVKKRSRWIVGHVEAARTRTAHVRPREYVSGEAVHYLGRRYRLRVMVDAAAMPVCKLRGSYLEVTVREAQPTGVRKALEQWYRHRAREVLRGRLDAIAKRLRWVKAAPPMRLQSMRVQWGSCSPAGRITLHPGLVKAPGECIDYVLLHELCHLASHDHSPRFYRLLDRHLPNWRAIKQKLDGMAEDVLRV
jgi:predicted metal-dependent hydrolase